MITKIYEHKIQEGKVNLIHNIVSQKNPDQKSKLVDMLYNDFLKFISKSGQKSFKDYLSELIKLDPKEKKEFETLSKSEKDIFWKEVSQVENLINKIKK